MTTANNSSVLKDSKKRMRMETHYLMREFSDLVKENFKGGELLFNENFNTEEMEKAIQGFIEKNVMEKNMTKIFKSCIVEDLFSLQICVRNWTKNEDKEVSKTDVFIILTLVKLLQTANIMTVDFEIEKEVKKDIGVLFNRCLIILDNFLKSVEQGLFWEMANDNEEGVLALYSIVYIFLIMVLNTEKKHFDDKNMKHHQNLLDEDGNIKSRKFIEVEDKTGKGNTEEKVEEEKENTEENKNKKVFSFSIRQKKGAEEVNPEPDLSGITTTNKKKDTSDEFLDNESSDEMPILEVAK